MKRPLLAALPALLAGAYVAWVSEALGYFSAGLDNGVSALWGALLLGPFLFLFLVAWRTPLLCMIAVLAAVGPLGACYPQVGNCEFLLVLSPLWLWAIVAITAVLAVIMPEAKQRDDAEV